MSRIVLPPLYRFVDLVAKIRTITNKQQCPVNFRRPLAFFGLSIEGKIFWRMRAKNSFMQIYSVQFLNPDPEEHDRINGKIVADEFDNIFDRQMDKATHHELILQENHPYDFFHPQSSVKFDKYGRPVREGLAIPSLDKRGCYKMYLFEDHPSDHARCNKLLSRQVEMTCSPLKVTYAYFDDATDSFLTVKLVKWKGEGGDSFLTDSFLNVYGKICTSDTLLCGDDRAKSVVFDLKRDECVIVKPSEYIRMHRPMTIVPMGHQLKVEISLFHNTMGSGNDDKEDVVIANETCLLTAKSTNQGQCEEEDYTSDYEYSSTDDDDNQNQSDGENQLASDGENQSAHGEDDEKQSEDEDQYAYDDENQAADENQSNKKRMRMNLCLR